MRITCLEKWRTADRVRFTFSSFKTHFSRSQTRTCNIISVRKNDRTPYGEQEPFVTAKLMKIKVTFTTQQSIIYNVCSRERSCAPERSLNVQNELVTCYELEAHILQCCFLTGCPMKLAGTFNFLPRTPNLIPLDFFFTRPSDKEDLCRDLITGDSHGRRYY